MTAPLTDEGGLLRQTMEARAAMTLWTAGRIAEPDGEKMLQADVIGRKSPRELTENLGLRWRLNLHFESPIPAVENYYIGEGDKKCVEQFWNKPRIT